MTRWQMNGEGWPLLKTLKDDHWLSAPSGADAKHVLNTFYFVPSLPSNLSTMALSFTEEGHTICKSRNIPSFDLFNNFNRWKSHLPWKDRLKEIES